MRILITAAQSSSHLSGIQRHAITLTRTVLKQPAVSAVDLVIAPWQSELFQAEAHDATKQVSIHIADMKQSAAGRNLWYFRSLPALVAKLNPDVVHLSYPMPVHGARIPQPIALTLHDLYPYDIPENFGFPRMLFNRAVLQQCMRNVDAIACVSDTTLLRMRRHASRSVVNRAVRIFNCVEPSPEWSDESPIPGWCGEPFLLSVSQHRRNKNIPLLLRVFRDLLAADNIHPHTKLVIIGITGPETALIKSCVSDLALEEKVIFLEGISEDQLQWSYRHCELLMAPSSIEGFGLPVAEALMVGCRVVCSDIPAFREIATEQCTFFSLQGSAAANLHKATLAALALPQPSPIAMPQLSAETIGPQYIALYEQLLAQKSGALDRLAIHRAAPAIPAYGRPVEQRETVQGIVGR